MRTPPWYLVVSLALAACGELRVESVRVSPVVPLALHGQWVGTWSSATDQGGGDMTLRVQEFAQAPVVTILVSNPCLVPAAYEIVMTGESFELRSGGTAVLAGTLAEGRTMVGTYGCAVDAGTWQVAWQKDLPEIVDLSGTWEGSVSSTQAAASPLVLSLQQASRGGQIVLEGTLQLPGLLSGAVPVLGSANFREQGFEIALATPNGTTPSLQLAGFGDSATLSLGEGMLAATPGPLLPFTQALWEGAWVRR